MDSFKNEIQQHKGQEVLPQDSEEGNLGPGLGRERGALAEHGEHLAATTGVFPLPLPGPADSPTAATAGPLPATPPTCAAFLLSALQPLPPLLPYVTHRG